MSEHKFEISKEIAIDWNAYLYEVFCAVFAEQGNTKTDDISRIAESLFLQMRNNGHQVYRVSVGVCHETTERFLLYRDVYKRQVLYFSANDSRKY